MNDGITRKEVIAKKVIILILSLIIFLFLLVPLLFNSFKGKDLLPGVVHGAMKTSNSDLGSLANIYLPLLLDLSVETLDWKKDTIMLYVVDSDSSDRLNEYFLNAEKRVNDSLQFFKLDKIITDSDNLMVVAYGWLYRLEVDLYSEYKAYQLSFKMDSGRLLLKDFFEK